MVKIKRIAEHIGKFLFLILAALVEITLKISIVSLIFLTLPGLVKYFIDYQDFSLCPELIRMLLLVGLNVIILAVTHVAIQWINRVMPKLFAS